MLRYIGHETGYNTWQVGGENKDMADTKLEVVERYGGFSDHEVDEVDTHVAGLMAALGLDTNSEHFRETSRRVAAMLLYFSQKDVDLTAVLKDGFETSAPSGGWVVQKHIPFKGLCAHHLLPFFGTAAVGYIPKGRVVGLSKLTRLVSAAGLRSPSTQEAITEAIATTLQESSLQPVVTIVVARAVHGCMAVRGVNAPGTETITFSEKGLSAPSDVPMFFHLIGEDW